MTDPLTTTPGQSGQPENDAAAKAADDKTPGMSMTARSLAPGTSGEDEAPPSAASGLIAVSKVRWHESWIIRAAIISIVIIGLGYLSGAYFAWQGILTIGRLAHMSEVEDALGSYLETIKTTYQVKQDAVADSLRVSVSAATRQGKTPLTSDQVMKLLTAAGIGDLSGTEPPVLTELTVSEAAGVSQAEVRWLNRDQLQIGHYRIELPKGKIYEQFKATEDLRQRYQLIGVRLEEQITPTLIQASATIMVISFILLGGLFWLYAQKFKDRIGEVLQGFAIWSEHDSKFRFSGAYSGELKMITSQFNAMANEVEANRQKSLYLEKIASWQIIARKLAHEIKNPLTPIQMMVSQLKRRYKGDDPDFGSLLEEAQQIITEEVTVLRRMVDNFSNFARLPQPEPKPIDLNQICRHVVELQKNVYPQHKISFESRFDTAPALADDDLLRQVLLNLIKNACEACGDTPSVITVALNSTSGDHLISVRDNGPGIPPEMLNRVFEAYFTTKHTGPNPGMGLGLAVCQKIVMDHGGKLSVTSRPGETVFTIRLPKDKKPISQHGQNS
jgi:signal transduction histidine kinase